jgi:hypothetical protein
MARHEAEQFELFMGFMDGDKVVVKTDDPRHLEVYTVLDVTKTHWMQLIDSNGKGRRAAKTDCRHAKPIDYL